MIIAPLRTKPRYLGDSGAYSSVPYDWGGFASVTDFQSAMTTGEDAGSINSKTTSPLQCSSGVDCSGFVSRAWNLAAKHGTGGLDNISYSLGNDGSVTSLRQGDILNLSGKHVLLFDSANTKDAMVYEATTDFKLDRVVHHTRTLSYILNKLYRPERYKNLCDYVSGDCGCEGEASQIFFNKLEFNFWGRQFFPRRERLRLQRHPALLQR